ncbi:MAG: CDP-alcohol phosphatidyltransferase family protein [candidate division WOR-3 bacterium]|nr:CDP-alcohol phosphatidyltransferase family protein [candidate division WOR-3 bacterium]
MPITNLIVRLKIPANIITLMSIPFSLLNVFFFAQGLWFIGGILLVMVALFDTIDGEVARRSQSVNVMGAFLDSVIDRIAEILIFFGLFLYYQKNSIGIMGNVFNHQEHNLMSIIIFLTAFSSLLVSYIRARAEGVGKECKIGLFERPVRFLILIVGVFFLGPKYFIIALSIILVGNIYTIFQRIFYVLRQ